ncbi:Dolichyl-phosphate-mannose-protein mannosyltransferase-domain-containing protein [Cyathus striatus]|nr:Dolichyl-phosphate-mannose-protein mannosyltransferase-domain-containing protein [Cyathus striatus]
MSATVEKERTPHPELLPFYNSSSVYTPLSTDIDVYGKELATSQLLEPATTHNNLSKNDHISFNITPRKEWIILIGLTVVASAVRTFKLSHPGYTLFHGDNYLARFRSPLFKLLTVLVGKSHFNDSQTYAVAMRLIPVTLNALTIPLSYLTLRLMSTPPIASLLASIFLTFETGLIIQSRHMPVESILFFFSALAISCWIAFSKLDQRRPFSLHWWTWLTMTGLSLGAAISCKWSGLLTVAMIGVNAMYQLWKLEVSSRVWMRHFMARALCLIVVPLVFYLTMFQVYFMDGNKKDIRNLRPVVDVSIGSTVTIKQYDFQQGYLSSSPSKHRGGSKQQQVVLNKQPDIAHSNWIITNTSSDLSALDVDYTSPFVPFTRLQHNARIKLHSTTSLKHLHSHDIRPYKSSDHLQNEVSVYGFPGYPGDANDDWFIEIVKGNMGGWDGYSSKRVRILRTVVRFRHALTGCYLVNSGKPIALVGEGSKLVEVTCNKGEMGSKSLWSFEKSEHPAQPEDADLMERFGFLDQLQEILQDTGIEDADHEFRISVTERLAAWFMLGRGGFPLWQNRQNRPQQIYYTGNPIVWWLGSFSVISYVMAMITLKLRTKYGYSDIGSHKVGRQVSTGSFLFIGWAFHFFPFFYRYGPLFDDYFPALYFAILLLPTAFDLVAASLPRKIRMMIGIFMVCAVLWVYYFFVPLTYGMPWTKSECEQRVLFKSQDIFMINCNDPS